MITGIRIICAVVLLFCPTFSKQFYALCIAGGVSDIFDGIAARHSGKETEFGARLDTAADILFAVSVFTKVFKAIYIPLSLIIWAVLIAVIKCINIAVGFIKSGHFVSEHTVMNKICGALLFAIPFFIKIFPGKPVTALTVLTCALSTAAAIQEGYLIQNGKAVK